MYIQVKSCPKHGRPDQSSTDRYVTGIIQIGVYDRKAICPEILSHNEKGVSIQQFKTNREIQQTIVEVWI